MREILFRAKRKDNGEWIESLTLFQLDKYLYMFQTAQGEITYDLQHNITAILGGKKPFFVEVIPETVGRFTGLTDRNGTKIFEGDIVKMNSGKRYIGIVEYWEDSFRVASHKIKYFDFVSMAADGFGEVIGNVHDNPELLEVNEHEP